MSKGPDGYSKDTSSKKNWVSGPFYSRMASETYLNTSNDKISKNSKSNTPEKPMGFDSCILQGKHSLKSSIKKLSRSKDRGLGVKNSKRWNFQECSTGHIESTKKKLFEPSGSEKGNDFFKIFSNSHITNSINGNINSNPTVNPRSSEWLGKIDLKPKPQPQNPIKRRTKSPNVITPNNTLTRRARRNKSTIGSRQKLQTSNPRVPDLNTPKNGPMGNQPTPTGSRAETFLENSSHSHANSQ
jgi:hypothetical protein